jgi:hypothetical protein
MKGLINAVLRFITELWRGFNGKPIPTPGVPYEFQYGSNMKVGQKQLLYGLKHNSQSSELLDKEIKHE